MISYIGYITCRYEQLTKVFFVVATKIVSPFKSLQLLLKQSQHHNVSQNHSKNFVTTLTFTTLPLTLRGVLATPVNTYDRTFWKIVNGF